MREANPQATYLKDYKPPEFLIETVHLRFVLDEADTHVIATLNIKKNPESHSKNAPLELTGEELALESVRLDQRELVKAEFQQTKESLIVPSVPQIQSFILEIETRINPKANTALEGLYISNGMFCTQCEAEGFRKITYFLDRPDVMACFTTTLIADKTRYPVLLSNGNKTGQEELRDGQHSVTWEDPFKKPAYLFALVAGQLECVTDTHSTPSGRTIDLKIYVEKHNLDKCDHAMRSLQKAMRWDEEVYGREYDLDLYMIVAVGHFNMGAMENKGLNIFNTKYVLARPDTATDTDYEHIEGVIGHEYFHNWTGNRITLRDWFQLSLKEGLTVFRDQEFSADQTSRAVKRINDVDMLRTKQFSEDAGPLAHPIRPESYIEINNFYTLTVYEKGAEVIRMIHTIVGAEGFRKGTDLYFLRHDAKAVTTDEFVKAIEDANETDLSQFRLWYSQAGTPQLQVTSEYDSISESLAISVQQSCPSTPGQATKKPFHIPFKIAFLGQDGSEIPVQLEGNKSSPLQQLLHITQTTQCFRFINVKQKPVISVLRGFTAPVKLTFERSFEDLAFLLAHDTDTFNRWDAGQQLACQIMLKLIDDIQQDHTSSDVHPELIDSYRLIFEQPWQDLSYLSLLLTLPSETYLSELMRVIDVEAIHLARQVVKKEIASALHANFLENYHSHRLDQPGIFDATAIGRRKLKNTCLSYLAELETVEVCDLCETQFNNAKNMTDQIAALSIMANSVNPAKHHCLSAFYQQWKDDPLVIDKWFALQATSHLPGTLDTVLGLLEHSAFDIKNPNRVRSLIGAFTQANPVHFHAIDGRGYRFLSDHVIVLNNINPQVASRIVSALTHWRRYDGSRQQLMVKELERIIAVPDISKDVYEIATKSLA